MKKNTLGIWALIILSIGTIISALSIVGDPGGYVSSLISGTKYNLLVGNSTFLSAGLEFLFIGFALQILEKIYENRELISLKKILLTFLCGVVFFSLANYLAVYIIFR
jgi:hypothetical protein